MKPRALRRYLPRVRSIRLVVFAAAVAGCASPQKPGPAQPSAPVTTAEHSLETPHFLIRWADGAATDAEVAAVRDRGERALARYHELLGPERLPTGRLGVILEGDAKHGEVPTVSMDTGDLLLFRFPGVGGGYEAPLAHELMHALRWRLTKDPARATDTFLFVEEGFAETMAVEAGFPSLGFPTFGFPVAVAAGTWIESGQDIPLADLVRHHGALNFRCMAQAYNLRLSFMTYLRQRVGLEPLIRLAYASEPLRPEALERVAGEDLSALGQHWRSWARAQYDAVADHQVQAALYREKTPIHYFNVCGPEVLAQTR